MAGNPPTSGSQQLWPPPPAASGSMNPQSFAPPYPMQRASGGPQGHQFVNHQFHPQGQPQGQPPPYSQQFLQRPVQPGHAAPPPYPQMSMPMTSGMPQHAAPNHGGAYSSSYTFAPSPYGLPQNGMSAQFQPPPQISSPFGPAGGQPWLHANQAATPPQQAFPTGATAPAVEGSPAAQQTASDWQEFDAADGRRYYYNKATKQSSWEKPAELMTPIERADASTVWKEFTTPEGRKYYYNKETKQSKWTIPDDLKAAREEAEKAAAEGNSGMKTISSVSTPVDGTSVEKPSDAVNTPGSTMSTLTGATSSSFPVASIGSDANTPSEPAAVTPTHTAATTSDSMPSLGEKVASSPSGVPVNSDFPVSLASVNLTPSISSENLSSQVVASPLGGASVQDIEEAKKGMAVAGKINDTPAQDKTVEDEPIVYANKQDAKNAFKSLLESANVAADWTWDQAMRVIISDKRYGALKTLGERKQAFNEYMMQRKKLEAEERRLRQRKAKEEFMRMLEESEELTSSMRWSKALVMFEDDERFKAVEQEADREDLFRSYLVDLQKKEKAKAQEEYRRNRTEFRQFLEASSFIKVDTQWRKVQDLLEEDERCTRLDKIDRLDVFQDYIRDLEKEEDEQKKRQKEQLRRAERKNRDAFRKMMEEHIAAGVLTAKTFWRDYCQKVKDSEAYEAVASNTSGSTPKDLFEDVVEELEKKYNEDKARVKDALKQEKVTVSATWTFEDFKTYTQESIGSLAISDFTLQLVYEDLIDRAKEREEKEAKKRKRLAKDFTDKLSTIKDIDVSSSWEECKPLVDDSFEYRSMGDDSLCMEIFNEYISRLQEKAKEKERKREEEKAKKEKEREDKEKKKDKERKEKEREKEKDKVKDHSRKDEVESDDMDVEESHVQKDDKRREKDKERKHRKRHQSTNNDVSSDKDDKEESRKSHRHGSDRKKSRKHAYSPESESESRHKKHKRDQKDGSRRSGGNEELEDGELGEDGEIQ